MNRPSLKFIREPQLEFAHGQYEEHPKDGLFLYGPAASPIGGSALKFGVVGTKEGLRLFSKWSKSIQGYIPPFKEGVAHHSAFPGFQAAFGLIWPESPLVEISVQADIISKTIRIANRHEAIKKTGVGLNGAAFHRIPSCREA